MKKTIFIDGSKLGVLNKKQGSVLNDIFKQLTKQGLELEVYNFIIDNTI